MKKITLLAFVSFIFGAYGQTDKEMVLSTINKSEIEGHIYFLASDELKGRETGSPELDIAAAYIANFFRRLDVKPAGDDGSYYQDVPMVKKTKPEKVEVTIQDKALSELLYLNVDNFDFEGKAVYVNFGLEEDLKGKDLKGKLLVAKAGSEEGSGIRASYGLSKKKKTLAMESGAIGIVELMESEDEMWERFKHYFNEPKTTLGDASQSSLDFIQFYAKDNDKALEKQFSKKKKLEASIQVTGISQEKISTKNVIGYMEGSDPKLKEEIIIYSAHYDHVGIGKPDAQMDSIYNGARDNAVGTVTVLSTAENFSEFRPKRSSLFILFTGEEKGLLGSRYYADNPVIPLEKVVYCFNSDNGGYNDTTKTTIIGLNRTTAGHHFKKAAEEFGLTAIDDPAPEQGLFDRSDNVSFAAKGVPAPTYHMGFHSFDDEIKKYYHQASDNPDNLDYDYLLKFFQSYILSSRLISNDPETPFWVEGDKYYEVGKALYQKETETSLKD